MATEFSPETIRQVIDFHGHQCPGLAIGIRAAEYVRAIFPGAGQTSLVCVTETDMCGVDAIQYLTGCTFGKGNLVHLDYGKIAFSFFDRHREQGIRIALKIPDSDDDSHEMANLMEEQARGALSARGQERLGELRAAREHHIMAASLTELFDRHDLDARPPRPARIMHSLVCDSCSEKTMESRTRRFAGRTLCIPCFKAVEQKV